MMIQNRSDDQKQPAARFCGVTSLEPRRLWMKRFVTAACAGFASGTPMSDAASFVTNPLRIKVSALASLVPIGGSVIVTYDSGVSKLLINRASQSIFHVMDPTCTHAGCTIHRYVHANGGASCPCHGSFYSITGQVLGGPARQSLTAFSSTFDGQDILSITIPGFQFRISMVENAPQAGGNRLKLTFPTIAYAQYSVQRSAALTDGPSLVSFAQSPEGALSSTTLTGTGNETSVWVAQNGTRGFFSLSLALFEL